MNSIIYIVGLVVVVLFILTLLGLRWRSKNMNSIIYMVGLAVIVIVILKVVGIL